MIYTKLFTKHNINFQSISLGELEMKQIFGEIQYIKKIYGVFLL